MIKVKNELEFVYKTAKAFINFKLKKIYYFFLFKRKLKKKIKNIVPSKFTKIQLGSSKKINNFFNTEIFSKYPIDIINNLPFSDNILETIFSSHVVEHVHIYEFKKFLRESYRVLKKNGINIIATPSIEKISKISYGTNNKQKEILFTRQDKWIGKFKKTPAMQINLTMRNFGHRFIYDLETISFLAKEIGFRSVESVEANKLIDEDIKEFIFKTKPELWHLETEIFIIKK